MKLKIVDIEKTLGIKIKRNFYSVGVDTATTTGLVFLKSSDKEIDIDYLVLSFKTANHKEVYNSMVKTFERVFEEGQFAVIEEVFVGFSRAGSVELAKYGSFAISACVRKGIPYETISAVSARSKFKIDTRSAGKGNTKTAVGNWIKEKLNISFDDNNINDALVLALCGIVDGLDFRSQEDIKKSTKKAKRKRKKRK
jgi:Holliday junction resolvasome RuvABC endonuclease subunit